MRRASDALFYAGMASLVVVLALWAPPAMAACSLAGGIVTCTGPDDDGFIGGDNLTLNVLNGAFVQSIYDGEADAFCPRFRSALRVGQNANISNRGQMLGRGNCGVVIDAKDGLILTNDADMRTDGDVSFVILATNRFDITNRGAMTTVSTGSSGIAAGNTGRFLNAANATINTTGADSAAVFVEDGNTLTNDGRITTVGNGSFGFDVGARNTITNTGTITTSGIAASGIRLRGAGNTVTNRGTITALPSGAPRDGEDSIGIAAEAGTTRIVNEAGTISGDYAGVLLRGANNELINSGTISARVTRASVQPGAAVLMIGGTHIITNTGTIRGTGTAAIRATSNATYNLTNSGRIEGDVFINTGSRMSGTGTVVGNLQNGGTLAPGLGIGTLTLTGAFIQTAGRLEIDVDGSGAADRLIFGRTLSFSGTVAVNYTGLPVRNGQVFTFLTSSEPFFIMTLIAPPRVIDNSPFFLEPTLRAVPNGFGVAIARIPYASTATNPAQTAVAQGLDAALPLASTAAAPLYALLDQSDAAGARAVFDQISSDMPTAAQTWGVLTSGSIASQVSPWLELAPADSPHGQWRTWGSIFARDGESGPKTNSVNFDYDIRGGMAGADYAVVDGTRIGFMAARAEGEVFFAAGPAHGKLSQTSAGLYLSQAWAKWRAGAGVIVNDGSLNSNRTQTIGGAVVLPGQADTGGESAFIQTSYALSTDMWLIKPAASLTYVRAKIGAYNENLPFGLNVQAGEAKSLRGDIGVRALAKPGPVHISVAAFWSQNFKDNDRTASARINALPASDFVIGGRAEKRGWLNTQIGANIEIVPGMMARLGWSGILNDRLGGHTASAGISYRW